MVGPLRRVIVKRPRQAFRDKAAIDAQWKGLNYLDVPDPAEAEKEFDAFDPHPRRERRRSPQPCPRTAEPGLDSLYTHDPGVVTDAGAVIFQTGKIARRGEGPAVGDAMKTWGVPVLGVIDGTATAEGGRPGLARS